MRREKMEKQKFRVEIVVSAKHHMLREFRRKNGLSQKKFGELLGINQLIVGAWENFKNYPKNPKIMEALCNLLEAAPEDLFPTFVRNPGFLKVQKSMIFVRQVDLKMLETREIPALPSAEEIYEKVELAEKVREALSTLTPREEKVVRKRFGIEEKEITLREIGKDLGVSRSRIQQIEAKALRKLRHPSRSRQLKSFTE